MARPKGIPFTEEQKQLYSRIFTGIRRGTGMTGKKHTLETRQKMSKSMSGEKNHKWKGGATPIIQALRNSLEYREWRLAVYKRDEFACQECGDNRGGNLEADHILPLAAYKELAYEISNGVTLCEKCHTKKHQKV